MISLCCTHTHTFIFIWWWWWKRKEEAKNDTAKSFHIRYVSMHTWIIVDSMHGNKWNEIIPKLLGQNMLGLEKSESIHSFIQCTSPGILVYLSLIQKCVNVWTFMNKARLDAFGCNYKLFFTCLVCASHSIWFVRLFQTIFFSRVFFASFFSWFQMVHFFSTYALAVRTVYILI